MHSLQYIGTTKIESDTMSDDDRIKVFENVLNRPVTDGSILKLVKLRESRIFTNNRFSASCKVIHKLFSVFSIQ